MNVLVFILFVLVLTTTVTIAVVAKRDNNHVVLGDSVGVDDNAVRLSRANDKEPTKQDWERYKEYNNCYAYALGDLRPWRKGKPQPGVRAGLAAATVYRCQDFEQRMRADNPGGVQRSAFYSKCPRGWRKVFLAVDDLEPDTDYHFWRQDNDGTWTHKPGLNSVQRLPAQLDDPRRASRRNGDYEYTRDCGFFCVRAQAKTE